MTLCDAKSKIPDIIILIITLFICVFRDINFKKNWVRLYQVTVSIKRGSIEKKKKVNKVLPSEIDGSPTTMTKLKKKKKKKKYI